MYIRKYYKFSTALQKMETRGKSSKRKQTARKKLQNAGQDLKLGETGSGSTSMPEEAA
jgi:hypothetical protein